MTILLSKKFLIATAVLSIFLFSSYSFAYQKGINCGGLTYTATNGDEYISDQRYTSSNGAGYVDGVAYSFASSIKGTEDALLYQFERQGASEYKFDLPNGFYKVTLKFAELHFNNEGERVFSVWVEEEELISNLDIYKEVGINCALDYDFTVEVKDGQLNIKAKTANGSTTFSAILVKSLIIPQPQQLSLKGFDISVDATWNIAVNFSDSEDYFAAQQLQEYLYDNHGLLIPLQDTSAIVGTKYIILANPDEDDFVQSLCSERGLMPDGQLNEEGYLLEAFSDNMIIISANNSKGIFYGVQTLKQLINGGNGLVIAKAVKIKDWPDNNFRGAHIIGTLDGIDAMEKKIGWMASLKMNIAIFENETFWRLDEDSFGVGRNNRLVLQELFDYCRRRYIEPIPQMQSFGVADNILTKNPACAEGFWVQGEPFKFVNNVAVPTISSSVFIQNPSFEADNNGDGVPDGWIFGKETGKSAWMRDRGVFRSGIWSVKTDVFPPAVGSNVLQSVPIAVTPKAVYSLSFWFSSIQNPQDCSAAIKVTEIDPSGRYITEHFMPIYDTLGVWKQETLNFATQSNCARIIIKAAMDKGYGAIWLDDLKLERMNGRLINVIRTPSSNITVTNLDKSQVYVEGVDYEVIGSVIKYPYDTTNSPTKIKRLTGSKISNSQIVLVSYDTVLGFNPYVWKIPYCPSEPKTYEIFFRALDDVIFSLNPDCISIGHDEIYGMNRDSRCRKRGLSNAQLLAEDINKINEHIHGINPNIKVMMWDDMINPWHNGGEYNFQMAFSGPSGRTSDAIDSISKDIIPIIWWYDSDGNLDKMKKSPEYFKSKGFDYLISPWYNERNIRMWADILSNRKDSLGMLDTTWYDAGESVRWKGIELTSDYSWQNRAYPDASFVSIWHMDENNGMTVYDETGNNNSGSIYGASWVEGKIGTALYFDGMDDYIKVLHSETLNLKDEITVSLWFKFDGTPIWWNRILEKGAWTYDNSKGSFRIVTGKGELYVAFQIYLSVDYLLGGVVKTLWTPILEDNRWYHLVGIYSSGQMHLYLDGVLIASDTNVNGQLQQTPDPLCIGANSYSGERFKGIIDEVKIYNRALTSEEILEEYNRTE